MILTSFISFLSIQAYFFEKGAKFQLTQFVRLYCPSTKKGKGVKGAQWLKYGKEWQQSEYS